MRTLISYICGRCGAYVRCENGEKCKCDTMKDKKVNTEFVPFYSDECKTMITSSRQMDRVYKQHGLRAFGDAPFRKKYEHMQRHREERLQEFHKKEMGLNYKPGSNVRYSDHQKALIPTKEWMQEKAKGL